MLRKITVEIQVIRKGGYLGVLRTRSDSPPSIKMNDSDAIKTVLQGTFEKHVYTRWRTEVDFDPYVDELQPVLTINGVSHKLGVFVPVKVEPSYSSESNAETLSVEAYDRAWYVQSTTGKSRIYFKHGTNYLDAVEQLLAASGISFIDKVDTDAVLAEDREDWDLGTDYLTIVNDLLKEISYKPLWFDSIGTAVLEPISTPMVENIKHRLDTRNAFSLVHPGLSRSIDFYRTPNVFICVCDNPEKTATLTAIARNTNNYSPLSVQNRGREIIQLEHLDNIANQEALQQYANKLLFNSLMTGEVIEVTTSLLPGWGAGDVVSLHYNDLHALCISRSWSMELKAGGNMNHALEKIVYNLSTTFDEEEAGNG